MVIIEINTSPDCKTLALVLTVSYEALAKKELVEGFERSILRQAQDERD